MYKAQGQKPALIISGKNSRIIIHYLHQTYADRPTSRRKNFLEYGERDSAISVRLWDRNRWRRRPGTVHKVLEAMGIKGEAGVTFLAYLYRPTSKNANIFIEGRSDRCIFNSRAQNTSGYFNTCLSAGTLPWSWFQLRTEIGMLQKTNELIDKGLLYADFWNSGIASDGCMEAAPKGGYFYILWTGEIHRAFLTRFKTRTKKETMFTPWKKTIWNWGMR